ncbi:hypothetical protein J4Q44_G00312140 [Coregonus suidteri]|uniref:Uncharacterized protein n=1 Tax=Coregonus suidteri TaxID=861788 RepID=A0AAN8QB24_9TELE
MFLSQNQPPPISRPFRGFECRPSGTSVRPHGSPLLPSPQAPGGCSGGAEPSKPPVKPQLKHPTTPSNP